MKAVVAFSGGIASWAAAGRARARYGAEETTLLFAEWEAGERQIQEQLGRPVTILRDRRGGGARPFSLWELRDELEAGSSLSLFDGENGCGCWEEPDGE